jgi:threonine aldolase
VEFVAALEKKGVRTFDFGKQAIRAVTHLNVTREEVMQAGSLIQEVAASLRAR